MSLGGIQPVNIPFEKPKADLASNPGAPVVPASMADQIKPDTEGMPEAGFEREEFLKKRNAELEAQIAAMKEDRGGIDVSQVPIENEIAQRFDHRGNLPVSHWDRSKWEVKWKLASDLAMMIADDEGWEVVSGDPRSDPKCSEWLGVEYIGKGKAAGTTLRGHGDVLLCKMPRQKYDEIQENNRLSGLKAQMHLETMDEYGEMLAEQGVTPGNLIHTTSRPNSPIITRVFANGPTQSRAMDRMMRSGSLPGASVAEIYPRR